MYLNLRIIAILAGFILTSLPFLNGHAADVKIVYGLSVNTDEAKAVKEAIVMMRKTVTKPNLLILFT